VKYEKNRKIAGIDELKLKKLMKILILPIIAALLIVVIVVADRSKNRKSASATTADSAQTDAGTNAQGSSVAPDNSKYTADFSSYGLQKNSIPEIDKLISDYQKAKTSGDAAAMYKVFGKKDQTGMEALQTKLNEDKKVYEAFKDTINYAAPGAEDGSYIIYINSKIKFKGIDTLAPSLTRAYVMRDDSGNYFIKEPDTLNEEEKKKVDEADSMEDVRLMDSEMRKELAKAVVADAKLGSLYSMLQNTESSAATAETTTAASGETTTEEETVKEVTVEIKGADELTAAETTTAAVTTTAAETTKAETTAAATTAAATTAAETTAAQ